MSLEENKALVRRYVAEVINGGNLDGLDEFLGPQYKRYLAPSAPPLAPETQRQRLAGLRAAFPYIHLATEDMIAEGDRVAFRGTLTGTHQGEFLGIAATLKQIRVFASDVVRVEGGKFAEHWGGPDLFVLLQQLGAVISAPPAEK